MFTRHNNMIIKSCIPADKLAEMQPTIAIMVIGSVQSPKRLHLSNTYTFCHKSAQKSCLMELFKHRNLLKESSVNIQTVPTTENLPKPQVAHGFSHLWIKPVWTMSLFQYAEFHRRLRLHLFHCCLLGTNQWP